MTSTAIHKTALSTVRHALYFKYKKSAHRRQEHRKAIHTKQQQSPHIRMHTPSSCTCQRKAIHKRSYNQLNSIQNKDSRRKEG